MVLKHLSQEDIDNYINADYHKKKNDEIQQHLILCEKCRKEIDDYQLMIKEIKEIKTYEPGHNFVNMVTKNLPEIYSKKERPIIEIISLIMISVPFSFVIGFLLHNNIFKFIFGGKMYNIFSSLIQSIYYSLNSFKFINDNIDVFGLFIFYMIAFSILNRLFLHGKLKKKYI
jgi:uncharacterized membrane protein